MAVELGFKHQFYNLQGSTINERKRNFYKLLKSTSLSVPEDEINFHPRNYLEEILYVDVLIHFKKIDRLIEILQQGQGILTSKILKQQWFFQEAFKDMSADDIVNNFFPTLSFPIRMKVLKKLSLALSEERMDDIFDRVLERYGLFIAQHCLFSCSSERIANVIRNNELTLLPEQIKRILHKDSNLLKIYFEEFEKNSEKHIDDYDFLSYIAWKKPNLYFELGLNCKNNVKLGRYTTRALLKTNENNILKDIKNPRLHRAVISRKIQQFDEKYVFTFFPDNMKLISDDDYISDLELLISKYPRKKQWNVLSHAFNQAYQKDIVEHLDVFDIKLANFFPKDIKQKWAEIYLNNGKMEYLKYFNPEKAFKLLTDKIIVTSDRAKREQMIKELISVCYENQDYSTYERVLEYICKRHFSNRGGMLNSLIYHISENIDYDRVSEIHFHYIGKIIDRQRVPGQYLLKYVVSEYLYCLVRKKLPLNQPVIQYVKDCVKQEVSFELGPKKSEESVILRHIVNILPTLELENKKKAVCKIMADIIFYDRCILPKTKDNWIDLNEFPVIVHLVKEVFTKEEPYDNEDFTVVRKLIVYNYELPAHKPLKVVDDDRFLTVIKTMIDGKERYSTCDYAPIDCSDLVNIITKQNRNALQNNLLEYFFNHFTDVNICYIFYYHEAVNYFLHKEPEIVAKYFDDILAVDIKYHILDYGAIKSYSHLNLDERLISRFKAEVMTKANSRILLEAFSKLMSTQDFLDWIKDYIPDEKKLDLENAKQKELYEIQCQIAESLKTLEKTTELAPVVMQFSQGDYLQFGLPALYSLLYQSNEEKVIPSIDILVKRAVSTRKHGLFLSFELLPLKTATDQFLKFFSKETNISAKKYVFRAVIQNFLKNPLKSLLNAVFEVMNSLDKNDTESIQIIVEFASKIPIKYKIAYIEKVWNLLTILEQQDVRVVDYRMTLLNTINKHDAAFFLRFSENFCENLIKTFFLSGDETLLKDTSSLNYFIAKYLLAFSNRQHYDVVFDIIKNYKNTHWVTGKKDKIQYIFDFFTDVYAQFDENDINFLNLFDSFWQTIFNSDECFYEYILLRLMIVYKENPDIKRFTRKVDDILQKSVDNYGPYVSDLLVQPIKVFFSNINTKNTDFTLEHFALSLLKCSFNELNCCLVFNLVKDPKSKDEDYGKVRDALNSVNNLFAKSYFTEFIKLQYVSINK